MKNNRSNKLGRFIGPATLALGLLVGNAVMANTVITQTETFSDVPPMNLSFTFNELDSTLYSFSDIVSIKIRYQITKTGGKGQADNDSGSGGSVTFTQSLNGLIGSSDVAIVDGAFQTTWANFVASSSSAPIAVTATTGDATDAFNNTGLGDYAEWSPGVVVTGNAPGGTLINSAVWNQYHGTGTFDIDLSATQSTSITGLGGVQTAQVVSSITGFVEVEYIVIPEPGTIGMMAIALGSAGAFAFLRRRKKA